MKTWLQECTCGAEHEVNRETSLLPCDCGKLKCRECTHRCVVCGYEGCEQCMTYDEEAGDWLCGEQDCKDELERRFQEAESKSLQEAA